MGNLHEEELAIASWFRGPSLLQFHPPVALSLLLLISHSLLFLPFIAVERRRAQVTQVNKDLGSGLLTMFTEPLSPAGTLVVPMVRKGTTRLRQLRTPAPFEHEGSA